MASSKILFCELIREVREYEDMKLVMKIGNEFIIQAMRGECYGQQVDIRLSRKDAKSLVISLQRALADRSRTCLRE